VFLHKFCCYTKRKITNFTVSSFPLPYRKMVLIFKNKIPLDTINYTLKHVCSVNKIIIASAFAHYFFFLIVFCSGTETCFSPPKISSFLHILINWSIKSCRDIFRKHPQDWYITNPRPAYLRFSRFSHLLKIYFSRLLKICTKIIFNKIV